MMVFNLSKLIGRVHEMFRTEGDFGKAMGFSPHTTSDKLSGKSIWKQPEIARACDVLGIDYEDIPAYFFVPKVQ